jgi:uncharacterized membrane protein YccC
LLCAVLRIDRTAYRYASITLAVVMLIPRTVGPWTAAGHRFVEVSTGIIVALVIAAAWPERLSVTKSISAQASIPAETGS